MSIKLDRKLLGLGLQFIAMGSCFEASALEGGETTAPKTAVEMPGFQLEAWPFLDGQSSMVAAAKVAGYYAVANASSMTIEVRDIAKTVLHTVTSDDIKQLLPDMALTHDAPVCGMTFTPSGRFLYIAVCNSQGSGAKDAVLALNVNTRQLTVFKRLELRSESARPQSHYGMTYFASKLFVGSDLGVYRLNADRNKAYQGGPAAKTLIPTPKPVKDIALDMVDQRLYVLTEDTVYRLPSKQTSLTPMYQGSNLSRLSFSRVFGRDAAAGLYLTRDSSDNSEFLFVPMEKVRKRATYAPQLLEIEPGKVLDFATTADGKILYSNGQPSMLSDTQDDSLSYQTWLRDELSQYVTAVKSLIASDDFPTTNTYSPDGFLHRKLQRAGTNPNTTPVADNVGWAIYLLMAADKVTQDPEIEPLIELLIERHAGLKTDGLGGEKTFEGHFVRNYESDGSPKASNPQPQVYISMKFLPAVIKAAELYPENEKIAEAKKYLEQIFVRSSDTIRANQRITWELDDFGPLRNDNGMANETWIYGDLGAAQDPRASYNYESYVYERDNFSKDQWLEGEPVIKPSHAAFIVMGGTLVLKHHFDDPHWKAQNDNYYAMTQAETDDLGSPYFAAFSAGNNPTQEGSYYNDGPSDHPGNYLHFPAVLGFGQHGKSGAMVGGYFAYRDDRRQDMVNAAGGDTIKMLTRWSMDDPDYLLNSIGIADFWFGAIGLAETIAPGTVAELRNTFFRPEIEWETDFDGNQVVNFSVLTPRHVFGIREDGSRQSFGFQRAPFTVPGEERFVDFDVEDPKGDWVELDDIVSAKEGKESIFSNPDFENGLQGWQYNGDAFVEISEGVSGLGAKVYSSSTGSSTLIQAVDQSIALEGSQYRVSAFIRPELVTSALGGIRVYWSEAGDSKEVLGEIANSNLIKAGEAGQLVSVDTIKPAGANYLHIEYVVEGAEGQSFVFDNTSLQLFGAMEAIDNGDFEDGSRNWTFSHNQVSVISKKSLVPEGEQALRIRLSGGQRAWRRAETDFDIANDPDGTRYIFKAALGDLVITDSEFDVQVDITDGNGKIVARPSVAGLKANTEFPDELTFTMRKRPGESNFHVTFRMRQNSNESEATDQVIIDNFRVYKQRVFHIEQCTGAVTGC